jgi:hypothetical protein
MHDGFGAGFAGQVAVKWALLPIYRSLRVKSPVAVAVGGGAPTQPAATA